MALSSEESRPVKVQRANAKMVRGADLRRRRNRADERYKLRLHYIYTSQDTCNYLYIIDTLQYMYASGAGQPSGSV